MQRDALPLSEKQIALDLGPGSESALRAAYQRLELSRYLSFEQAMTDPAYAIGIRNLAEAMVRRLTLEAVADACYSPQLNCRLQLTQAFRAELRAARSVQQQESINTSQSHGNGVETALTYQAKLTT